MQTAIFLIIIFVLSTVTLNIFRVYKKALKATREYTNRIDTKLAGLLQDIRRKEATTHELTLDFTAEPSLTSKELERRAVQRFTSQLSSSGALHITRTEEEGKLKVAAKLRVIE